jgi:hypothetical protein
MTLHEQKNGVVSIGDGKDVALVVTGRQCGKGGNRALAGVSRYKTRKSGFFFPTST